MGKSDLSRMMIYSLARCALAWYYPPPMHYLLMYDVVDDYVERRTPYRREHISLAREAVARGDLVLGGALAQPADGVVLLFRGSSPAAAEAFAKSDPYVRAGIVIRWRVREWTTVVGKEAENPLPQNLS
jgi:uncharacterized protein